LEKVIVRIEFCLFMLSVFTLKILVLVEVLLMFNVTYFIIKSGFVSLIWYFV